MLALGLADAQTRTSAVRGVVTALFRAGELDRAEALVRSCPGFRYDDLIGTRLDEAAIHDSARAIALAEKISHPANRAQAMLLIAERIAANSNFVLAGNLLDHVEELAATITETRDRVRTIGWMITTVLIVGDRSRADALAAHAEQVIAAEADHEVRERSAVAIVWEFAQHGYQKHAESLARTVTTAHNMADITVSLAAAASKAAEPQRARELATRAEALTFELDDYERRGLLMARLTNVFADIGDVDRAAELVRSMADPMDRVRAAVGLIQMIARSGDTDKALTLAVDTEAFIAAISDIPQRTFATRYFVQRITIDGSQDRAEKFAAAITPPAHRAEILALLAQQTEPERAQRLIAQILRFGDWTAALTPLVRTRPDVLAGPADELPLSE